MMKNDLISVALWGIAVFTCLGIFFGFALAATAKRFAVELNPVIEEVRSFLPSANCGACGFAGCQAYAEAVVEENQTPANLCIPGGAATAGWISKLTGKAPAEVEDRIVVLRCHGTVEYVRPQADYLGIRTCTAAAVVFGGPKMCKNGCLGLGDCVRVCPFFAMQVGPSGIVEIDSKKCTGCGLCIPACPKKILDFYPRQRRIELACVAREKAKAVRAKCLVGCTTCLKCIQACPAGALSFNEVTIHIDHQKCLGFGPSCKEACVDICPTVILHRVGQIPREERV